MRAKKVNENYPMGAANDPNAPWNEKEDDSNFDMKLRGNELIITRRYNHSAEDEFDEDEVTIDPETFEEFAAKKLGIDSHEKWENDDYLEIEGIADAQAGFEFTTSWGDFETDIDELVDLTDLF